MKVCARPATTVSSAASTGSEKQQVSPLPPGGPLARHLRQKSELLAGGAALKLRNLGPTGAIEVPRLTLRFALLALFAAALALLAIVLLPDARVAESRVTACRQAPTPVCLAELGTDLAMTEAKLPAYLREVDWLARLGHLEAAYNLEKRVQLNKGKMAEEAQAAADRRLANHRLAAALRNGRSLKAAIEETPAVGPGDLWIAALTLLGRSPHGDPPDTPKVPEGDLANLLSEMALRIEELAQQDTHAYHLVKAAEIRAILGERAAALATLSRLPRKEPRALSFSEELFRAVGTGPALAAYESTGATRPHILLNAALAEDDASRKELLLRTAFTAYMDERPWPDFDWMGTTVRRAIAAGQPDVALDLARRTAETARTVKYPFQIFANIHSAEALYVAGAPAQEVRASIDFALNLFPEDQNQYIATGVHMGPILWKSSGLATQARRSIATLLLQLNDVGAARRILQGVERDKIFTWVDVLDPAVAPRHYDQILVWAGEALAEDEFAYVRASFATSLMQASPSDEQRRWALATTQNLLAGRSLRGRLGAEAHSNLIRIAELAKDSQLRQAALASLTEAALDDLNYSSLIRAAIERHVAALRL